MRVRSILALLAIATLAATPVMASFGGGGGKSEDNPSSNAPESSPSLTPRQQAERLYADAYDEVAKAKKDADAGKTKNADKHFQRARDRAERALELDPKYHEAWNLVGYSSRRMGDLKRSLEAYGKCLEIKPDYAPAREYLGEAYLVAGDLAHAREQLAWLERLDAKDEAATLRAAIDAAQARAPAADSTKAASAG